MALVKRKALNPKAPGLHAINSAIDATTALFPKTTKRNAVFFNFKNFKIFNGECNKNIDC